MLEACTGCQMATQSALQQSTRMRLLEQHRHAVLMLAHGRNPLPDQLRCQKKSPHALTASCADTLTR
jgi:hypothetical protein